MNIFKKAKSLLELEDMMIQAEKEGKYAEETIENDYMEMREKLLGESPESPKKSKKKSKKPKAPSVSIESVGDTYRLIYVEGNQMLPYVEPVVSGNVSPVDNIDYEAVESAPFIRDYTPSIQDGKLILKFVNRRRELVDIEQDIEIRERHGEKTQFHEAFYCENFVSTRETANGYITAIRTNLLSTKTKYVMYKILTFFAVVDGEVKQIRMEVPNTE